MTDTEKREEAAEDYASVWSDKYRIETGHMGELAFKAGWDAGVKWLDEQNYKPAITQREPTKKFCDKLERRILDLETRLATATEALENCVSAWGDYAPDPRSKAAKVLHDAREALAKVKGE